MTLWLSFLMPIGHSFFPCLSQVCLLICLLCVLRTCLGSCHVGGPQIWPSRNGGCPFEAWVLLTVASSQGNCLSLCPSLALDLGRVISIAHFWGCLLHSSACSILPTIFTVCPSQNLTRYLEGFFLFVFCFPFIIVALGSEVGQIGN